MVTHLNRRSQASQIHQTEVAKDTAEGLIPAFLKKQVTEGNASKNLKRDATTKIDVQQLNFY